MSTTTTTTTNRAGGEKRGNSKDRAARRAFLIAYWARLFGRCECVWCGRELHNHAAADMAANPALRFSHVEADRWNAGDEYGRRNIVPACRSCNLDRADATADEYGKTRGLTEDDMVVIYNHMVAAPYRGH